MAEVGEIGDEDRSLTPDELSGFVVALGSGDEAGLGVAADAPVDRTVEVAADADGDDIYVETEAPKQPVELVKDYLYTLAETFRVEIRFWGGVDYDWPRIAKNLSVIQRAFERLGVERIGIQPVYVVGLPGNDGTQEIGDGVSAVSIDAYEEDPERLAAALEKAIFKLHGPPRFTRKLLSPESPYVLEFASPKARVLLRQFAFVGGEKGMLSFGSKEGFESASVLVGGGTFMGYAGGGSFNQDAIYCNPSRGVGALADGMGCSSAGGIASAVAIESIAHWCDGEGKMGDVASRARGILSNMIQEGHPDALRARDVLPEFSDGVPDKLKFGTTLSILRFWHDESYDKAAFDGLIYGDSPVFIVDLTAGSLVCRPPLQTKAESRVRGAFGGDGDLSVRGIEEIRAESGHVLTGCISPGHALPSPVKVRYRVPLNHDVLGIICSDGLANIIPPSTIVSIAGNHRENAWRELLREAGSQNPQDDFSCLTLLHRKRG